MKVYIVYYNYYDYLCMDKAFDSYEKAEKYKESICEQDRKFYCINEMEVE